MPVRFFSNSMKSLSLLLALSLPLSAQKLPEDNREDLVTALMESRDPKAFEVAVTNARNGKVPEQTIIEARFLYLVDQGDEAKLAAYSQTMQKQLPDFTIEDSAIFAVREDFESVIQYTLALAALQKKDNTLFKKHITEAFWLSPNQGVQFAPLINEVRMNQEMAKLTIDLTTSFENQRKPGALISLKELMGDSPAILLHLWNPWVQQSMISMQDYAVVAKHLTENKIPPVSLLLSGTAESREAADNFLKENPETTPGSWLVDKERDSLSAKLRVQTFPVFVLIDNKGKILFNGDPSMTALWDELQKLSPKIKRPTKDSVLPDPRENQPTEGVDQRGE